MKVDRSLFKIVSVLFVILITLASLTQIVYADAGPKPSLTITIRGLNTDKLYID